MRRMPTMVVILGVYFLVRNWNGDVVPLVAVGAVAVVGFLIYRAVQSRSTRQRIEKVEQADIASLTELVQSRLARTANRILDVEGRPGLAISTEANGYFQRAVSTFVAADEKVPAAASAYQLQAIVTDLDDALWRLDAAEAVLDGEDVPPRPTTTPPVAAPPSAPSALPPASRDAVTRWSDDRRDGGHRRKRSC